MSESTTPITPTPGAAEPGPTPGTGAPVEASVAPAPLPSSEPVAEVAAEVVQEAAPTSILSEAKSDEPLVEAPAAEPTEEAPKEEVKAEEAPAPEEPAKPEPLAPPTYDAFTLPEGVTLAEDKITAFTGLMGETEQKIHADPTTMHTAMQEFGQKAVNLYLDEVKEATERSARLQRETWDRTLNEWQQQFRDDPEIGKNRQDTTIQRIGGLLNFYEKHAGADATNKVRQAFALTGAGNHPEVLRWAHWMASRLTETSRVVPITPRAAPDKSKLSPAQRLYKTSTGAA